MEIPLIILAQLNGTYDNSLILEKMFLDQEYELHFKTSSSYKLFMRS